MILVIILIIYDPLWETLKKRGLTTYALINRHSFSSYTIYRLKHNMGISTSLINRLCIILDCRVEDIIVYTADEN